MNTIAIRKLLDVVDVAPELADQISRLVIHLCKSDGTVLTEVEIYTGQSQGKLDCVKLYKNRTGHSLMDAKRNCEDYFARNGLNFKSYA